MTRRRRRALARSLPTCRASQPSGGVCCYRGSGRARREGERRRLSARALIALSVAFAGACTR
jgi:hypothetical protein